jgi:hypothetical protein
MPLQRRCMALLVLAISTALAAQSLPQSTSASPASTRDTSYLGEQGSADVTRVVPVPPDLSPETRNVYFETRGAL